MFRRRLPLETSPTKYHLALIRPEPKIMHQHERGYLIVPHKVATGAECDCCLIIVPRTGGWKPFEYFEGEAEVLARIKACALKEWASTRIAARLNEEKVSTRTASRGYWVSLNFDVV
jgi:hypothetical protein